MQIMVMIKLMRVETIAWLLTWQTLYKQIYDIYKHQGSKGIRQWPINCTSPMMIHKIIFVFFTVAFLLFLARIQSVNSYRNLKLKTLLYILRWYNLNNFRIITLQSFWSKVLTWMRFLVANLLYISLYLSVSTSVTLWVWFSRLPNLKKMTFVHLIYTF